MRIYISHGAGTTRDPQKHPDGVDWFIVEPRENPEPEAERLRQAGRTVVALDVEPWLNLPPDRRQEIMDVQARRLPGG